MADSLKNQPESAAWWVPGVRLFLELWGWLVVPVIAALFIGQRLDKQFDTRPAMLLITAGIAFVITMYGIASRTRQLMKDQSKSKQPPSPSHHDEHPEV